MPSSTNDTLFVGGGKSFERFSARVLATVGIVFGMVSSGGYAIVFLALSMPVGIGNTPTKGMDVMLAVAFFLGATAALVLCWIQQPFTRYVLVFAASPILVPALAALSLLSKNAL